MIDEVGDRAAAPISRTAAKVAVIAAFFTLVAAAYVHGRSTAAASVQAAAKNPLTGTEKNVALGLNHFDAHCASCHGAGGKGDTEMGKALGAPDLTGDKTQAKSDAELFRAISKGRKAMPAFEIGRAHV